MESNLSYIRKLQKLGLTEIQAKIYLILLSLGKEKASTIAKIANVDRSNVYKAIDKLQKRKIVSKILGPPNLFEAIPLEELLELLVKAKFEQYTKLSREAELFKKSYNYSKKIQTSENDFGMFKIINFSRKAHFKAISIVCKNAQKNVDLILNKKTFIGGVILFSDSHLRCLQRGVKYRLISEAFDTEHVQKEMNPFLKNSNFEMKIINQLPLMEVCVVDNTGVGLSLVPNKSVGNAPFLITRNNLGFAEIVLNHFDIIWNKAEKITKVV